MSVSPADIWGFANISASSADEACQRASISRAYYAAYHACKVWHASLPVPGANSGPSGGFHQELINQLRNPDRTMASPDQLLSKSLGYMLQELKGHRFLADYDLAMGIAPNLPSEVCQKAKLILGKV